MLSYFISTYIISTILPLGPQTLKYLLLFGILLEKFADSYSKSCLSNSITVIVIMYYYGSIKKVKCIVHPCLIKWYKVCEALGSKC